MAFTDRLANRGSISTGYEVENSIHLSQDDSEEIYYTTGSSSSDQQKGTFSFWFKRGRGDSPSGYGNFSPIQINDYGAPTHRGAYFSSSSSLLDMLYWNHKDNSSQWTSWHRPFRDFSAWYHIVVRIDTTQADGDNRHRMYVNGGYDNDDQDGNPEVIKSTHNAPVSQNDNYDWFGTSRKMTIGKGGLSTGDAYLADYHYVDGLSLGPESFGERDEDSAVWKPKAYSGSHGNNGFHLKFESSGSLGTDSSGNGNNFSLTNVDATNQSADSPTNNWCVLNNIDHGNWSHTYTRGNLKCQPSGNDYMTAKATFGLTSGKWYWETKLTDSTDGTNGATAYREIGITSGSAGEPTHSGLGYQKPCYVLGGTGHIFRGTSVGDSGNYSYRPLVNGTIIGHFMDLDNGTVFYQINGGRWGTADQTYGGWTDLFTNTEGSDTGNRPGGTPQYFPAFFGYGTWSGIIWTNFGNPPKGWTISSGNADADGYGNFEYSPVRSYEGTSSITPINYYALCTKNLAEYG